MNGGSREGKRPRPLDAAALWDYAVKALAARAQSVGQIRQKLRNRAERAGDVEDVVARLKDYGYLQDRKFAESFAASRLDRKMGSRRVVNELRQRKVAPSVAESSVRAVYENVDETALIEAFLRRKYRLAPRESFLRDEKELASAYRRLMHAGFSFANIVKVLKRFVKNPELLDQIEPPSEEVDG